MHTAFELKRSMITVEKNGLPASREDVLNWELRDRLGVVIDSPLGALGAGLLVLLCTTAFYDLETRRRRKPLYAPIYLFHVGRGWGFHGEFDFWPERKEILVADPAQTLPLINSHGITHLAVPDVQPRGRTHRYKESEDAADRLKQAFLYAPSGTVNAPTVVLRSSNDNVLRNFENTINVTETLALREQELVDSPHLQGDNAESVDARRYVSLMRERSAEIDYTNDVTARARERVRHALRQRCLTESLAQIETNAVLSRLP